MQALEILVHVKVHEDWSEHIDVALNLAKLSGGRAHGFCNLHELMITRALFRRNAALVAEREAEWRARAARIETSFRKALTQHGIEGSWTVKEGLGSDLLVYASRFHDLSVIEQFGPNDDIDWDPAQETALSSGAPTLIVPHQGLFPAIGRRIAVAWNGSREAAAAVHGAMPLLLNSDEVVILSGKAKDEIAARQMPAPHDLPSYLERKAIKCRVIDFAASDAEAGAKLLQAAKNEGCDMLVMGAFGRSWIREWVLGGATRHIMRNMDMPVLMAH